MDGAQATQAVIMGRLKFGLTCIHLWKIRPYGDLDEERRQTLNIDSCGRKHIAIVTRSNRQIQLALSSHPSMYNNIIIDFAYK